RCRGGFISTRPPPCPRPAASVPWQAQPLRSAMSRRPTGCQGSGESTASDAARAEETEAIGYPLFDHLIRPQQQRRRDGEAEGLGGLQIDDELELGGLLDGKVRRLGALEDAID